MRPRAHGPDEGTQESCCKDNHPESGPPDDRGHAPVLDFAGEQIAQPPAQEISEGNRDRQKPGAMPRVKTHGPREKQGHNRHSDGDHYESKSREDLAQDYVAGRLSVWKDGDECRHHCVLQCRQDRSDQKSRPPSHGHLRNLLTCATAPATAEHWVLPRPETPIVLDDDAAGGRGYRARYSMPNDDCDVTGGMDPWSERTCAVPHRYHVAGLRIRHYRTAWDRQRIGACPILSKRKVLPSYAGPRHIVTPREDHLGNIQAALVRPAGTLPRVPLGDQAFDPRCADDLADVQGA